MNSVDYYYERQLLNKTEKIFSVNIRQTSITKMLIVRYK